jgi:S-DNA-T family DNA segregation ATPase FtsK/SpoIIIE
MSDATTPSQQGSTFPSLAQDSTSSCPASPATTSPASEVAPKVFNKRYGLAEFIAKQKLAAAAARAHGKDDKSSPPVKNENGKRPLNEEEREAAEPVTCKRVVGSEQSAKKSKDAQAVAQTPSPAAQSPAPAAQSPSTTTEVTEPAQEAQKKIVAAAASEHVASPVKAAKKSEDAPAAIQASTIISTATANDSAPANTTTTTAPATTSKASASSKAAPASSKAPASHKTSSAAQQASITSKTQDAPKPAINKKIPAAIEKKTRAANRTSSAASKPSRQGPASTSRRAAPPPREDSVSASRYVPPPPRQAPAPAPAPRRVVHGSEAPGSSMQAKLELGIKNRALFALADEAKKQEKTKALADKTNTASASRRRRADGTQPSRLSGRKTERDENALDQARSEVKAVPMTRKEVIAQRVIREDSDDEEENPAPKPRKARKLLTRKEHLALEEKKMERKKAIRDGATEPAAEKTADEKRSTKRARDEGDEEDVPAPKAKPAKKASVPQTSTKRARDVDDDDDEAEFPAPKKVKAAAPPKKASGSDASAATPVAAPAAAPVAASAAAPVAASAATPVAAPAATATPVANPAPRKKGVAQPKGPVAAKKQQADTRRKAAEQKRRDDKKEYEAANGKTFDASKFIID